MSSDSSVRLYAFGLYASEYYYSGFNKDPKQNKIELHVFVPKDTVIGKYTVAGKILLLPIAGNGDVTFIFGEFTTWRKGCRASTTQNAK